MVPGGVLVTFTMRYSPALPGGDDPAFLGVWLALLLEGATFPPTLGEVEAECEEQVLECASRSCTLQREGTHHHTSHNKNMSITVLGSICMVTFS